MESRSWAAHVRPWECNHYSPHGMVTLGSSDFHRDITTSAVNNSVPCLPPTLWLSYHLSPLRRGVKLEECNGNGNWWLAEWREGRELKNLMRFVIAEQAHDLPPHLLPDLFLEMGGWKRLSHCLSCRRPSCTEGACQPGLQAIQDRSCPISHCSLWQVANPLHPISLPLPHSSLVPKMKNSHNIMPEILNSSLSAGISGFTGMVPSCFNGNHTESQNYWTI